MAEGNRPLFGFQPSTNSSASSTSAFGAPASSDAQQKPLFGAGPPKSLFGAPAATSPSSGTPGMFGGSSTASTAPSNPSTLFGGASSTPASSTTPSLFGKPSSSTPTSNTAAPSIFGNTTGTTGGFSFGPKPATSNSTAPPSLFGSAVTTTTNTPSTTAVAPSLFGGTPAAVQEKSNAFALGAKMPQTSGGLFNNLGKTDAGTPQQKPASALSFTPAGKPPATTAGSATSLFGSTSNAAPSSTSLFGAKPDEIKAPSFSLGQNTGSKSLFGEVKSSSSQPAPSLFGTATTTAPASTQASASSSNLFGGQKIESTTTKTTVAAPSLFLPSSTTAAAAPSLFGAAASSSSATPAPSLFAQSSAAAQPAATTSTSTSNPAAPTSNLFGTSAAASTSATTQPATTTTAAPSLGGLFGNAQGNTANASAPTTSSQSAGAPSATAGAGLFGASAASAPTGTSTFANQQPSSRLASKSLDEIITTWSTSLATHQKTFANVAERVAKWDRQLVQNSSSIGGLYGRVFQAERDTAEVERQLSNVEAGQRELDARLSHYEAEVERLLNAAGLGDDSAAGGVDNEREQTYNAAEDCQSRLTDMGQNLTAMIEEVNLSSNKLSTTKKASASGDPLAQIVRVLNSHLAQLQAIDKGAQALTSKVEQAQKDAGQLAGRNGVAGGKDWIEGFGRSYLGRR